MDMRRGALLLAAMSVLSACAGAAGERVAGTALIGAALAAPAGPVGVAVGAGLGAAAGTLIPPSALGDR